MRLYDKRVRCGLGSFIILNDEGWILTAAHLLKAILASSKHKNEIAEFESKCREIQEKRELTAKQMRRMLQRMKPNPDWITNHSFWWGKDGVRIDEFKVSPEKDLATGQLKPFDPLSIKLYPTIKNPSSLRQGTSLCRLGFPLYEINSSFDEQTGNFSIDNSIFPVPRFPIEGIFTRNVVTGKSQDGKLEIKFLETSSPGLRGQSGGPIFDTRGTVWAIQSSTQHFPLGFSPKVKKDGKEVEENQFLNVGWGAHPEMIVSFLQDNGIAFKLSDY